MPSVDSVCERVQLALVDGVGEKWVSDHLEGCEECRFVGDLSRDFRLDPSRPKSDDASGVGRTLEALLALAKESGRAILSRYQLLGLLGRGGQGIVYRALNNDTGETVALKLTRLAGKPDEVVNAHLVRHPNVCRIYHTEPHGSLRLIEMELIEGPSLQAAKDSLDDRARLRLFREVCGAVLAAHDVGVLHLDLKPPNILIRPSGEPVVTDFGLSMRPGGIGAATARGGTRKYMAPEQRAGRPVDQRTDVYALGLILNELLPEPPARLRRVIARTTAESPEQRYASVRSLLDELDRPARFRRSARRLAAGLVPLAVLGGSLLSSRTAAPKAADVLVLGGREADGRWTTSAEVFESSSRRWRTIEPVPDPARGQPRTCELRAVRSRDQVLVLGGGTAAGCADDSATTNLVRAYSLATGRWSLPTCQMPCIEHQGSTFRLDPKDPVWFRRWKKGPCVPQGPCMLYGRNSFLALSLANEDVFVYGGCAGACSGPNELSQTEYPTREWPVSLARTAEIYRRATGTWTSLLPSLIPRPFPTGVRLGASVLVCGRGSTVDRGWEDATCELFGLNATKDAWMPAGRMPSSAPAIMLAMSTTVVLGLQRGHAWLWSESAPPEAASQKSWEASFFKPLPLPSRGQHDGTLTRLRDGRVLLAGGVESDRAVSTAQVFTLAPDGASGEWKEVARMRHARRDHAAVALKDGRILVAGGCGPKPLSSAEVYDPVQDRWIDAGRMSAARCAPQAVATW